MIKQSVRRFNWDLFVEHSRTHIDGYQRSEQREWIRDASRKGDVDQRRGEELELRGPPRSRLLPRQGFPSLSWLETRNKKRGRAVNSDRSRGTNGRKRNLMSAVPPPPHSLIWEHFHGQRVRNHLEPQVANNDTRSFLRKFPWVPLGRRCMGAYVQTCVSVLRIHEMLGLTRIQVYPFAP